MDAEKHANDDETQSEGRKANGYRQVKDSEPGPELDPYPAISKDDGVEVPSPLPDGDGAPDAPKTDQR